MLHSWNSFPGSLSWAASSASSSFGCCKRRQINPFLFYLQLKLWRRGKKTQLGRWLEPWSFFFAHTSMHRVHVCTSSCLMHGSCPVQRRILFEAVVESCAWPTIIGTAASRVCVREEKLRVTLRWSKAASVAAWGTAFSPFLHSTSFFSSKEWNCPEIILTEGKRGKISDLRCGNNDLLSCCGNNVMVALRCLFLIQWNAVFVCLFSKLFEDDVQIQRKFFFFLLIFSNWDKSCWALR